MLLPPLLLPGSALLPSACSPVFHLSSLSLTLPSGLSWVSTWSSAVLPPEAPALPFPRSSLSPSHSFLTWGRAWALLAPAPTPVSPLTLTFPSALREQPQLLLAPSFSFPFPFRFFLSKVVVPSFVCGLARAVLWQTGSRRRARYSEAVLVDPWPFL